jgi:hypothetical protein
MASAVRNVTVKRNMMGYVQKRSHKGSSKEETGTGHYANKSSLTLLLITSGTTWADFADFVVGFWVLLALPEHLLGSDEDVLAPRLV